MTAKPTARFREMLRRPGLIVAPFCGDAMTAVIAERVGFEAVYMTGNGTAAQRLAQPDVGLVTLTEMVHNARYITAAVHTPVIADADTGYGNAINVCRTVREYERAGVAAIHIEDQVWPKKCGFFEGKQVIAREEAAAKIRAATEARSDPDFVIIARTDALAVTGWDDTVARARSYIDAGADLIFVDGIRTREDLETYVRVLGDVPRMYNGGLLTTKQAEELGFKIMISGPGHIAAYLGIRECFEELKQTGGLAGLGEKFRRYEPLETVLGLSRIGELEKRYKVS